MPTIGDRMRYTRKLRCMTMDELGAKIGVTKQSIHRLELDMVHTSPERYAELAAALGVSPAWLLGWSDQPAQMTEDEQQLLTVYRSLNAKGRQEVIRYADYCATKPEYQKDTRSKAE